MILVALSGTKGDKLGSRANTESVSGVTWRRERERVQERERVSERARTSERENEREREKETFEKW